MKKFLTLNTKSFEDYKVTTEKELWQKAVADGYDGLTMEMPSEFKKCLVKKEDGTEEELYTVISSTADKDRHGDIVVQNWILDGYLKNPVILDSHNYDSIEHILGKSVKTRVENEKLMQDIVFALMNPKGKLAKDMADAGFLNALSVGFIPTEFDNEGRILKSELLEVSLVSVPANARALFEKIATEAEAEVATLKKEIIEEKPIAQINKTREVLSQKRELLKSVIQVIKEMDEMTYSEKQRQTLSEVRCVLKEMETKVDNWYGNRNKVYRALRSL